MLHTKRIGSFTVRQLPDRACKMHDQHASDIALAANTFEYLLLIAANIH